jgi:hypothetical protein
MTWTGQSTGAEENSTKFGLKTNAPTTLTVMKSKKFDHIRLGPFISAFSGLMEANCGLTAKEAEERLQKTLRGAKDWDGGKQKRVLAAAACAQARHSPK